MLADRVGDDGAIDGLSVEQDDEILALGAAVELFGVADRALSTLHRLSQAYNHP